jgi:hypothetical protein
MENEKESRARYNRLQKKLAQNKHPKKRIKLANKAAINQPSEDSCLALVENYREKVVTTVTQRGSRDATSV